MFLPDKFFECVWAHARCEGSGGGDAFQVFCLGYGEQIVHPVKMYGAGRLGASANMCVNVVAGIGDAGLNENAQRDVIPNESEGPLDYGVITQHLCDAICNCEVPRRLRLGMTGVSVQYRRHRM